MPSVDAARERAVALGKAMADGDTTALWRVERGEADRGECRGGRLTRGRLGRHVPFYPLLFERTRMLVVCVVSVLWLG
jgi:hypothetical protein